MRTSRLYLATLKESPAEAELISHQLMIRAGFIRKLATGIYTWLPLGIRVLRKVENIVREEMDRIHAQECLMPMVQPQELWKETERWNIYGPELLRFKDRHERYFCLGPTHEEVVTDLVRHEIKSYKQLPLVLYQIQTKFRDEIRPRFGVMRAREFLMKDAYSFHTSVASLKESYQNMYDAYLRIFKRLGLKIKVVKADTGSIGGHTSHEFQVLSSVGEDVIMYNEESDYSINQELLSSESVQQENIKSARGIEVGHIFQLGDKYSRAMGAMVSTETGALKALEMGCYGIGISRIVAAAIEQNHSDNHVMCLPKAMTPFQIVIIPIAYHKEEAVKTMAERLYMRLSEDDMEVLLEDRDVRLGVAFAEMNLIGVQHYVIVSKTGLARDEIEYKQANGDSQWFSYTHLVHFLKERT
jgi:prolyl-tRNA synthetase